MAIPPFRAIVQLDKATEADDIKRLALLFDEIHYLLPSPSIIKFEVAEEWTKSGILSEHGWDYSGFNFFRDTARYFNILPSNNALKETLEVFEKAGIAKPCVLDDAATSQKIREITDLMIELDAQDDAFLKLSGTRLEQYRPSLQTITLADPQGKTFTAHAVIEPAAIWDSYEITQVMGISHASSSFPVFLNQTQKGELSYRYEQYKDGLKALQQLRPEAVAPIDYKATFGEVAFNVSNSVFSSALVSSKTPEAIVKYRAQVDDARRRYLSSDLMELTTLISDDPWGAGLRTEVEKYIFGKLNSDLIKYDTFSREVWTKVFGKIMVDITDVAKTIALGSGAGGMLGNVIPHTSAWELVLLGGIAGAFMRAPKIVERLVDAWVELRKQEESSVAFIADLAKQ